MHCADPGSLKACPAPGAMCSTPSIVDFVHENCIGCGYCRIGCPFNVPRISKIDHTAYKCTLCSDRFAVGQGPACQKACPTQAIVFVTKDDMKKWADGRIKSRGFNNVGLYDPPGVSGTHVMYVLHHADRPEIYAGLPNDPRISPIVQLWKGVAKYVGLAVMAGMAIFGAVHYLVIGPNSVTSEDEESARRLVESSARAQT
jgi:formate dehydrogenase iron-sulfur subunit